MKQKTIDFYKKILEFSMEIQSEIPDVQDSANSESTLEELADYGYACTRAFEVLEDLLKHLRAMKVQSEKVLCLRWAVLNTGEPVRTDYTTATPRVVDMPKVPSARNAPEDYDAFMRSMGVPEPLLKCDTVRPHWPGVQEYISQLAYEAKPMPAGVDPTTTYPVFSVRYLKKKGVLDSENPT